MFTVHQCGRRDRLDVVSAAMNSSPNGSASQLLWTAVEGTPRTKRPNEVLNLREHDPRTDRERENRSIEVHFELELQVPSYRDF